MQTFVDKTFPPGEAENEMDYATTGMSMPEGLHGIFWMDQFGDSSVAKAPDYEFNFIGTTEILASFGEGTSHYDPVSRCVTPIISYAGLEWACRNSSWGRYQMDSFLETKMTMSFCFTGEGFEHFQIYQKVLLSRAAIGPFILGERFARLLGYDAGDGYIWVKLSVLNMTAEKKPWGWDRVSLMLNNQGRQDTLLRWAQSKLLPESMRELFQWAAEETSSRPPRYPVIQIVDGAGKRTEYYDEYLAAMQARGGNAYGKNLLMRIPVP